MKVTLKKRTPPDEPTKSIEVEMPCVPRVGDHVGHEPSAIDGYVHDVAFWWDDTGTLGIIVLLR